MHGHAHIRAHKTCSAFHPVTDSRKESTVGFQMHGWKVSTATITYCTNEVQGRQKRAPTQAPEATLSARHKMQLLVLEVI